VNSQIGSCHVGISNAASESKAVLEKQFDRLLRTLAEWHKDGDDDMVGNCLSATANGRPLYFNKAVFGTSVHLCGFLRRIGARYKADVKIALNMPLSQETGHLYLNEIKWVFTA
jgi:hypothetical protein